MSGATIGFLGYRVATMDLLCILLFIGAMGSRRTHEVRLRRLREHGVPQPLLDRLVAPLGLIPSTRDPATLALSTLGHIVAAHREAQSRSERGTPDAFAPQRP